MSARERARVLLCAFALSCTEASPTPAPSSTISASAPISVASAISVASVGPPVILEFTPNTFLARGTPTFVVGTLGSERAKRLLRRQVELIRGSLFPAAAIVDDISIDTKRGARGWPPNPVLYGGPQQNAVLAALKADLPFTMDGDLLSIGSIRRGGAGVQLITVLPERAGAAGAPGHPAFLLYAGTGEAGVAGINSVPHGKHPILIADALGLLATGTWSTSGDIVTPSLLKPNERPTIDHAREEVSSKGGTATVEFSIARGGPSLDETAPFRAATMRGVGSALEKLHIEGSTRIDVFLHPSAGSKKRLTQDGGDGHASVASGMVHVVMFDPKPGGPLERLVAHEATHVYTQELWGPPGTALLGEGIAVWVSGQYGGLTLAEWKKQRPKRMPIDALLGRAFSQLPERESYPEAGLFVQRAVEEIGLEKLREHLYGAPPADWAKACAAANLVKALVD